MMVLYHVIGWGIFLLIVLTMLAVDLLVLHKKPHAIKFKEALLGAMVPVVGAMLFAGVLYYAYNHHVLDFGVLPEGIKGTPAERFYADTGGEAVLMYLTGYLVELALSADNVFLFIVLMNFFKVPRQFQHRVLFWGVLGALVMRAVMIVAGVALITRFHFVIYIFGAVLIWGAIRLVFGNDEEKDPSNNLAVRLFRKYFPVHDGYDGQNFFTKINGKKVTTTLFVVLVCIEFTDLVFALDSIPAVFGITRDSYIVFTSNVFAILGLRSMYFLLAGVMDKFHLLKYGLAVVLGFVGIKMLVPGAGELVGWYTGHERHWEVDKYLSLAVIVGALVISITASLLIPNKKHTHNPLEEGDEAGGEVAPPRALQN